MQGGLVRPAFAVLSAGILESTVNTETEKDRFMSENTKNPAAEEFLPVCKADMLARGWRDVDFVLVTGDAYVDHPSFGAAIISRLLEAEGYRVGVLSQPDFTTCESMKEFGRPRYGFFIGGGNVDSMVAHYSVAKIRRAQDEYTPGGAAGKRPDRSATVYTQLAKQAYPDLPVILGGLEASLRRFAHYDYWDDKVRRALIFDAQADLLVYGMGEYATREIARRLSKGEKADTLTDIRGTAFVTRTPEVCAFDHVECPSYEEVCGDKHAYALATKLEYEEHDPIRGKALWQAHGRDTLVVNPPAMPLSREDLDEVAELPYMREVHPMYDALGGVAAIEEVRFSVAHNRGCFGGCNFCSLAFHQGRMITSRSIESCVREVEGFTHDPKFKGYIHDVGGPTADFRQPACKKQLTRGACQNRQCLFPSPCKNLVADHSDYLALLRKLRAIPGVKKVFIRSGLRFDYILADSSDVFFKELVRYHISGQLKVAPEHVSDAVLEKMGKPRHSVYLRFAEKYAELNKQERMNQFLVPYLMSSHPGCTMKDAVALAEYLRDISHQPEQVQDFYPTPSTLSTVMYYTGLDPRTMQPVYVPKDPREKAMQRALMQYKDPKNYTLVHEALELAHREDLIGFGPQCLIRPRKGESAGQKSSQPEKKTPQKKASSKQPSKPAPNAKQSAKSVQPPKSAAPKKPAKQQNASKMSAPTKKAQPQKSAAPAANAKKSPNGRARKAPAKRNP